MHRFSGSAPCRRGAPAEVGRVSPAAACPTPPFPADTPLPGTRMRSTMCVGRDEVRGSAGGRSLCRCIPIPVTTPGHQPSSPVCDGTAPWVAHGEDPGPDPVALRPHPTTLHPHLGTTLWMAVVRPVDGSCAAGGKPVSTAGTADRSEASSTGNLIRPRVLPRRSPHPDTASDQRGCAPSTLHTGPITTAGSLSLNIQERRSDVDGVGRVVPIGYPMAGMTPAVRRLYGGSPRPGSSRHHGGVRAPHPQRPPAWSRRP
jgi:hypothetical protein